MRASESVELIGTGAAPEPENPNNRRSSGLFTLSEEGGDAGESLTVETKRLIVQDGGQINASTSGSGKAGNVTVMASELVEVSGQAVNGQFPSRLTALTTDVGEAGDLTVETKRLIVQDGGQINASTSGSGKAGNLTVIASELVTVRDGAEVTVSSEAEDTVSSGDGVAGNLQVQADSISLDNEGAITAITRIGDGGDITLKVQDLLLLRRGSEISTSAGTDEAGGDGGNITIDAPFIIAFPQENSDITANAFEGDGGKININTNDIFGIEKRDQETDLSDITASSEFGQPGEVEINTSAIDPTRGLNNLPQEAVEAEVAQGCQTVGGKPTLEFFDIGRGGLPPTPEDLFSSEIVIAEWIPLDLAEEKIQAPASETSFTGDEVNNMTLLTAFPCQSK